MAAGAIGAAAFLAIVGPHVLDPTETSWLMDSGNLAAPYLGWWFFRSAPATLPPGANPAYGMEFASGVFFSDSIPLIALALRPFSPWLSTPFQYHGLWVLACFMLQAQFALLLGGALGLNRLAALLSAGLACFAPVMLARVGGQPGLTDHLALGAHWLILAGLWLNVRVNAEEPTHWWPALLTIAALVHSYFVAMLLMLWVAARWGRGRRASPLARRRGYLRERVLAYAGIATGLWAGGFFLVPPFYGLKGDGYGTYRMNVAAPMDPNGWSSWLPDLPGNGGDHEGFAYLGLGVLMLLALATSVLLLSGKRVIAFRRNAPLLLVLCAMVGFAVTHRIGLCGQEALRLPLPGPVESLANMLRASGRFAWPMVYAAIFGAVSAIARTCGRLTTIGVVALALAVQVVDLRPGWKAIRQRWDDRITAGWTSGLGARGWDVLAARYRAIWVLPPRNHPEGWRDVAWLAGTHGLATNAVDVARFDVRGLARAERHAADVLGGRAIDDERLYLIDREVVDVVAAGLREQDLLLNLDGRWILAPGAADLKPQLPSEVTAGRTRTR